MSSNPITQPPEGGNGSDAAFESSHEGAPGNVGSGEYDAEHHEHGEPDDAGYMYHPAQEHADSAEGEHDDEDDDYDNEDEHDDEDDEDDEDYFDGSGGLEFELVIDELAPGAHDDGEDDDDDLNGAGNALERRILQIIRGGGGRAHLGSQQLLALIQGHHMGDIDDDDSYWEPPRRMRPGYVPAFPKVPSEQGQKLMESGVFGAFDLREPDSKKKKLTRRLLDRELGLGDRTAQKTNLALMAQQMIPSSKPEMVIHYDDPVCCGQFSDDGNFFYACVKDFKVRMYDTSNPYNWKHYKTVRYPFGQWTLTDADLSPDNKWLAYTSLTSQVCFAPTDPNDTGDPYTLDLAGGMVRQGWRDAFPIFSIRFSGDGRTLVAGTGADSIVVYDIERREPLYNVEGHDNDVNAVCFADKQSPHILYSGSDDCTIKVWDTRSMSSRREAGAFVGHMEGLTYIDSKGDGRYILSNGKDQSMKLWDLRKAMSTARVEELDATRPTARRRYQFDYRFAEYHDYMWQPHPHDNSLVTFRGHKVQRTLIRCHFSPPGSTNSRYVYSGSYDGFVYVWNLDATIAAKIDVKSVTEGLRIPGYSPATTRREWMTLVRDVGWHPNAPLLVASSWNGPTMNAGTATLHSYNENDSDEAEPGMGLSVNEKIQPDEGLFNWRGLRGFVNDDDDDDDDDFF
ncbi:WD40-repeat-containing domain protein [Neurospora crassa]|nr:WD40-repeat-containing domain protein [Neurospora crassa]